MVDVVTHGWWSYPGVDSELHLNFRIKLLGGDMYLLLLAVLLRGDFHPPSDLLNDDNMFGSASCSCCRFLDFPGRMTPTWTDLEL
jgi:hypothetical protein